MFEISQLKDKCNFLLDITFGLLYVTQNKKRYAAYFKKNAII